MSNWERKSDKGATLYVCAGPYAGFHLVRKSEAFGVILGWVSITLFLRDIERFMGNMARFAEWVTSEDLHIVNVHKCPCGETWVMRPTVDGTPSYCPHCGHELDHEKREQTA